jgi:hypothetical protein
MELIYLNKINSKPSEYMCQISKQVKFICCLSELLEINPITRHSQSIARGADAQ